MKIGELARASGLAASRIRFYEASGLLEPARRQANGYREYGPDALTRLAIIDRAQRAGFALDEIRALLPPDLGAWPHDELLHALRHKVDEIALLEQRLAQNRRNLQALIDASQHSVSGRVRLKLYKGNVTVIGRESPNSLYSQKVVTFEDDQGAYDQFDAQGFIKLNALRLRLLGRRDR